MKSFLLAAALIAAPLAAQTTPAPAPATPPAPMTTPLPPSTATGTVATKFSLDTPIEQIVADPKAKAALDAALGADITANPFYPQIKGMSFNQVQPISQGQLTDEQMKKIQAGLAALN